MNAPEQPAVAPFLGVGASREAPAHRKTFCLQRFERRGDLARLEAARAMVLAAEAGVKRSTLADEWQTSIQQIDRMIAKAKRERR